MSIISSSINSNQEELKHQATHQYELPKKVACRNSPFRFMRLIVPAFESSFDTIA